MLAILCVLGILQVFFRYVLNNSLTWSEELSRYIFVWITFLGAAIATKEKMHIRLDFISSILPKKVKPYFNLLLNLISGSFLIALSIQGIAVMTRAYTKGLTSPALQLPLELVYSIIFIGALFILINHLYVMYHDYKNEPMEKDKE